MNTFLNIVAALVLCLPLIILYVLDRPNRRGNQ